MSKEAYYFSHDSNARNDPKILALRSEKGIQGYGIYWVIIEMLREEDEFRLPKKAYIWNAIAMQVQCKDFAKDDAKSFVEFCINECDLFVEDENYFWSNSLLKRMDKKNEISEKRKAAAKKRWEKANKDAGSGDSEKNDDANAMQNDANAKQSDASKGNKRKEIKEKKEKKDIQQNAFAFYENNMGPINAFMSETLGYWIDETNDELVTEAMKRALKQQKKWKYAEGILKNWINEGVKTVSDIPKDLNKGKKPSEEDFNLDD